MSSLVSMAHFMTTPVSHALPYQPDVDDYMPIDVDSHICDGCGRRLLSSGALVIHRAHCDRGKQRMEDIISNVGSAMLARRKRKLASMLDDANANKTQPHPSPTSSLFVPGTSAVDRPHVPLASPVLVAPISSPASSRLPSPPPAPPSSTDGARPRRQNVHLPGRYRDNAAPSWRPKARKHVDTLPEPLTASTPDPDPSHLAVSSPGTEFVQSVPQQPAEIVPAQTTRNIFGLYRRYRTKNFPGHDPEAVVDRELLLDPVNDPTTDPLLEATPITTPRSPADGPLLSRPDRPDCPSNGGNDPESIESSAESDCSQFYPYPNWTTFRLGQWYWTGSPKKSQSTFKDLVEILTDLRFCAEDLEGVNWKLINDKLLMGETRSSTLEGHEALPDDWHETDIQISVPVHNKGLVPGIHLYEAATLCHRKIVSMIRSRVTDPSVFPHLHLEPYELFWKPNSTESVRVHSEVYTSPAFIEAHDALQRSPPEPDCTRERVVIALMFSSDGTHLTEYGDAKLHPLYVEFGNESKARRSKQSNGCFEHVAYFESVSSH